MPSNRGVVYIKPGKVEVQKIEYPTFRNPAGKEIDHGVILKIVSTNICGSDQHMVRGRTTAPAGMVLGHEISGEVIEKGRDGQGRGRIDGLRRGRRACGARGRSGGAHPRGRGRTDRGHEQRTARPRQERWF